VADRAPSPWMAGRPRETRSLGCGGCSPSRRCADAPRSRRAATRPGGVGHPACEKPLARNTHASHRPQGAGPAAVARPRQLERRLSRREPEAHDVGLDMLINGVRIWTGRPSRPRFCRSTRPGGTHRRTPAGSRDSAVVEGVTPGYTRLELPSLRPPPTATARKMMLRAARRVTGWRPRPARGRARGVGHGHVRGRSRRAAPHLLASSGRRGAPTRSARPRPRPARARCVAAGRSRGEGERGDARPASRTATPCTRSVEPPTGSPVAGGLGHALSASSVGRQLDRGVGASPTTAGRRA